MNASDPRRRPVGHWIMFAISLVVLLVSLVLHGYVSSLGKTSTVSSGPAISASAAKRIGTIDGFGHTLGAVNPARHTVALTFDDGPDPTWTPRILSVLRRSRVPATFFVIGAKTLAHPELVRQELRMGEEIGSHTLTHVSLGAVPGWRANLELSLTQAALAGAADLRTSLLRMPYSSEPDALTTSDLRAARTAAGDGYVVVFSSLDARDWARPGVASIVSNAMPTHGRGAVILFHDGGGDRAQTVRALQVLIPALRAQGYRFETVSRIAGLPRSAVMSSVTTWQHLRGRALQWSVHVANSISFFLLILLVPIAVLLLLRLGVLVAYSRRHVRRRADDLRRARPHRPLPVSIIVPAYNEEVGIAASVRSLAASRYPDVEVIVVDDGSTDRTSAIVAALDEPRVRLIRQSNRGKASALNAGIAAATSDVIVTVDADTVFEPETLLKLVTRLDDPAVGAVSGNTKVGNRRRILGRWQHIEYVVGFNLDRRAFDVLDCIPTVPGAIGAFRRDAVEAVGGFSDDTLAEDTDLTIAINRAGWRVVYEDSAVAWTEVPSTIGALWRQRYRWSFGIMQSIWKHRAAVIQRRSSHAGRGIVYLLGFSILLPLLAPIVDLIAIYGILFSPVFVLVYWTGFNAVMLAAGAYAFRLDKERLGPLWTLPLQQFVYRQLMYLVIFQSIAAALLGLQLRWRRSARTGELRVPTAPRTKAASRS